MANRKPPITHSRAARAIAARPDLTRQQKAVAHSQYHRMGAYTAAAAGNPDRIANARARQQAQLHNRIGNARAKQQAQLHLRINNARGNQQARMASRVAGSRLGAPQAAPSTQGIRAEGRQKAGQYSPGGHLTPTPAPRMDARKISRSMGVQPTVGVGIPYPRR